MTNLIKRTAPPKYVIDQTLSLADTYAALEFYYHNNGLYALLQQDLMTNGIWTEGMIGLRNPAHRVVEFYVAKLWPGHIPEALPIICDNTKVVDAVHQIWKWSNFGGMKQVFARWFACFGDSFIKVATKTSAEGQQVYFQNIKPAYVTDIKVDERGFIVFARIDIPLTREVNGVEKSYFHTEIWDKSTQLYQRWETSGGPITSKNRLGNPIEQKTFSEFGIDFVPIVHAKFQDVGESRGVGAFTHALDKIDEANRMATRLHQLLYRFNDVIFALEANAMDGMGRPLPAPSMNLDSITSDDGTTTTTIGTGTKVARLPGTSKLVPMVPDLKYDDALSILNAHIQELERDLPEMAYFRLREQSRDLSGRAVRYLLSDAVDKIREARGNAETALARADEMALTIGSNLEIFPGIGSYENGDFEHSFADREVIPLSEYEKREIAVMDLSLGVSTETIQEKLGYNYEHERAQKLIEANALGENLLDSFDKGQ
jgi:hypothetical protein